MNKYSKRMDRLEAADDDLSMLVLAGGSREGTIAKYEAERGAIARHRVVVFLTPTDAQL